MTRAERLIIEKIESLERKLDELKEEKAGESIEEISLNKAAKLLRVGTDKIIRAVENRQLRAIPYRDAKRKKRYRFRVADIREYQRNRQTKTVEDFEGIETAEEITKRIFNAG
jgi:hypothetical protein